MCEYIWERNFFLWCVWMKICMKWWKEMICKSIFKIENEKGSKNVGFKCVFFFGYFYKWYDYEYFLRKC